MMKILITALLASSVVVVLAQEQEKPTAEQSAFFEAKVRPVLAEYCYKCHSSEEKVKGGLTLNSRAGMQHGGDSGKVLVPGNADASLLYKAIAWADGDLEMPPKQKMPASKIADIREWIEMGAPDPRVAEKIVVRTEIDVEKGKQFWSFQKPQVQKVPKVKQTAWPKSEVDHFVLAKLEIEGLQPAADARADQLLRRLYFDLVGLPPTPEEMVAYGDAWRKDPETAYRAKVDELLASKQFGERWGRHWMDVARYAESTGKDVNMAFPQAWRYRDYVIDSFNQDKPYDEFVMEQVAGDLLKIKSDEDWQENLIATGFLAIGTKGLNERDPRQFALDLADEQIDTTTQAVLGLTVSCARCHDHKTDPIPTQDYYALSGIFQSTKTYFGTVNVVQNRRGTKLLELPIADKNAESLSSDEFERLKEEVVAAEQRLLDAQQQLRRDRVAGKAVNAGSLLRLQTVLAQFRSQVNGFDANGVAKAVGMGVQDHSVLIEPTVLLRGELDRPAQKVTRGSLEVLGGIQIPPKSSGRLEFAKSLVSGDNPLTARVMVNRIWAQLFGQGIVTSTSNFGATGQAPTHPELLDHLALQFIERDWSVKSIIRQLVNTRSYQMATTFDEKAFTKDPENQFLWRMKPRRLDAEALRDTMLYVSGGLDKRRPRGSVVDQNGRVNPADLDGEDDYRSVYLPIVRDALPESLALFDAADPSIVTGEREDTNVPGQALYLMNSPFVIKAAEALAERLVAEEKTTAGRIGKAFQLCYSRAASSAEIGVSFGFLRSFETAAGSSEGRALALAAFCQSLLASAEFRYLN